MNQELRIMVRADGTTQVVREFDRVKASANQAEAAGKMQGITPALKSAIVQIGLMAAAYISLTRAIGLMTQAHANANAGIESERRITATLQATGRAANTTTKEMADLATQLQRVSNFGDEELLDNAINSLLRYDAISKDMPPRLSQLTIDMAGSMGGLEGAARMIGLVFNNAEMAINRLKRTGLLSKEQEDMAKSFIAINDVAAAQGVLLDSLQTKFAGQAAAGINAATQLKAVWGDYLESIGRKSEGTFNSMKVGLTSFLIAQTDAINGSLQDIDNAMIQTRINTANFSSNLGIAFKMIIMSLGGVVVTAYGIVADAADAVLLSINNVKAGLLGLTNGLSNIGNRAMEAITGVSSLKDALGDIASDFGKPIAEQGKGLDAFGERTSKALDNWKAMAGNFAREIQSTADLNYKTIMQQMKTPVAGINIDTEGLDFGDIGGGIAEQQAPTMKYLRDMQREMSSAWVAYYDSTGRMSTESLNAKAELYRLEIQEKYAGILGQQQLDEMYNEYLWDMRDKQLQGFADANQAELEAHKKMQNDKLSAQLKYLQAVQPLTQQTLDAQLAAYQREIEAYRELGLSKAQIDEMVAARKAELEKSNMQASIASWREQHEIQADMFDTFQNAFTTGIIGMMQIQIDSNNKALQSFVGMVNAMIQEVSRLIMKLMFAAIFKQIVFGATGLPAAGSVPLGGFDLPGLGAVASPNTGGTLPSVVTNYSITPPVMSSNNRQNEFLQAVNDNITGLRGDLTKIGFNINDQDGFRLMKVVKQAETSYRAL